MNTVIWFRLQFLPPLCPDRRQQQRPPIRQYRRQWLLLLGQRPNQHLRETNNMKTLGKNAQHKWTAYLQAHQTPHLQQLR
ncbi:hypothetical protein TYRP_019348 [Tyrophagus putrescentiae]|nr:hypothetical protein TYRP_019348 [Tyrophagus putrescentiae]